MGEEPIALLGKVVAVLAVLVFAGTPGAAADDDLEPDEVGTVNPESGRWILGGGEDFFFGVPGDIPFLGDWNGDGTDTPGLYRPSSGFAYIRNTRTTGAADQSWFMGIPGDIPIVGDWDGDGIDTFSVYRPSVSTVFISNVNRTSLAETEYLFGVPGDRPFGGDFNGDGRDEVGLHRASNGFVYYRLTQTSGFADNEFFWGARGDVVFAGDWTGDGIDTPGLVRPDDSRVYFRWSNTLGNADASRPLPRSTWVPVVGKIRGDRLIAVTAFRVELTGASGTSGAFRFDLSTEGDGCYQLELTGIPEPVSLGINVGELGEDGPELVDLDAADEAGCLSIGPEVVSELIAAPERHYVLLQDATGGELTRGQLAEARAWDLELVGANVRPQSTGDIDGFVAMSVKAITTGDICIVAYLEERIGEVTRVGIYEAGPGAAGPLVADLTFGPGRLGCTGSQPGVVALQMIAQPADFYVQIDTVGFPNGAVRAQLFIGPP